MTAACDRMTVVTPAMDLPLPLREQSCQMAAEMAWANNCMIVVAGQNARGELVFCPGGDDAEALPRTIAVVSDTEAISRWGSIPKCSMTIERAGRTAYVFQSGAAR